MTISISNISSLDTHSSLLTINENHKEIMENFMIARNAENEEMIEPNETMKREEMEEPMKRKEKEKIEENYLDITNGLKEAFDCFERMKIIKENFKVANDEIDNLRLVLDLENFQNQILLPFRDEQERLAIKHSKIIEQNRQENILNTFEMLESKLDLPTIIRICNHLKQYCEVKEVALEFLNRRFNWIKTKCAPGNFNEACDFLEYQMTCIFNQFRAVFGRGEEWHYELLSVFAAGCLLIFLDFYQPHLHSIHNLMELKNLWNQMVILDNCTLSKYKLIFMDHFEGDFISKTFFIVDGGLKGIIEKFKHIYLNALREKEGNKHLLQSKKEKEINEETRMKIENKEKEKVENKEQEIIQEKFNAKNTKNHADFPIIKLLDNPLMELINNQMIHFPFWKLEEGMIKLYSEHLEKLKSVLSTELQLYFENEYIPELLNRIKEIYCNSSLYNKNSVNKNDDENGNGNYQRPIFDHDSSCSIQKLK